MMGYFSDSSTFGMTERKMDLMSCGLIGEHMQAQVKISLNEVNIGAEMESETGENV